LSLCHYCHTHDRVTTRTFVCCDESELRFEAVMSAIVLGVLLLARGILSRPSSHNLLLCTCVCFSLSLLCDCDYYSQITRRTRPQVRHGSVFETRPDPVSTLGNIKKTNEVVKKVCVEPRPSALNMTLPAFAAERRRLQEIAGTWCRRPQQHRSISPARISAARAAAVD